METPPEIPDDPVQILLDAKAAERSGTPFDMEACTRDLAVGLYGIKSRFRQSEQTYAEDRYTPRYDLVILVMRFRAYIMAGFPEEDRNVGKVSGRRGDARER
jgi:hypothetical protein